MHRLTISLAVALVLLGSASSFAADEEESGIPPGFKLTRFSLTVAGSHIAETDFEDAEGKVSTSRFLGEFGVNRILSRTDGLGVNFRWMYSRYDFDGATGLVPGTSAPFRDLTLFRVSAAYRSEGEEFSWIVGPAIESSGEVGAQFSDTLRFVVFGGVTWKALENLKIGGGIIATTLLGGGARVIPVPTVDWQIDDHWRFRTEPQLDRVRVLFSYAASEDVEIGAEAGFYTQRYRLADDGELPGGFFRELRFPVGLSASVRISESLKMHGFAGVQLESTFLFENSRQDRVSNEGLGVSPVAGLGAELSF